MVLITVWWVRSLRWRIRWMRAAVRHDRLDRHVGKATGLAVTTEFNVRRFVAMTSQSTSGSSFAARRTHMATQVRPRCGTPPRSAGRMPGNVLFGASVRCSG